MTALLGLFLVTILVCLAVLGILFLVTVFRAVRRTMRLQPYINVLRQMESQERHHPLWTAEMANHRCKCYAYLIQQAQL